MNRDQIKEYWDAVESIPDIDKMSYMFYRWEDILNDLLRDADFEEEMRDIEENYLEGGL